ncbi:MAG: 30S ribosomal protein S18 [Candidatus Niyogibacteria bacterium]|nr:30S ribosomal protein S18 [Candidatus Niyogibacteria bacterium]
MIPTESKQCYFCTSNIKNIDFKDAETLKRFLSVRAKIMPRRKTAVCARHQRKLANAIKRARQAAILPYVSF